MKDASREFRRGVINNLLSNLSWIISAQCPGEDSTTSQNAQGNLTDDRSLEITSVYVERSTACQ